MLDVPYGITRRLPGTSPQVARERITRALAAEGFGVLTEIDVRATLQAKIGVDFTPYVILGACNPKLAHRALSMEPGTGLLLPCNVVVAADGTDAVISAASPPALFQVVKGGKDEEALIALAAEAEERLRRAVAAA